MKWERFADQGGWFPERLSKHPSFRNQSTYLNKIQLLGWLQYYTGTVATERNPFKSVWSGKQSCPKFCRFTQVSVQALLVTCARTNDSLQRNDTKWLQWCSSFVTLPLCTLLALVYFPGSVFPPKLSEVWQRCPCWRFIVAEGSSTDGWFSNVKGYAGIRNQLSKLQYTSSSLSAVEMSWHGTVASSNPPK